MTGERIMLVDDEEEFVAMLSKRMKARGLIVDTAATGMEALEKARSSEFDVIVLDLAMPGMDGIQTLQELLQMNSDLQVILLTGHATVQKCVEAIKLGAADFLEKPADFHELMHKIKEAITKKLLLIEQREEDDLSDILAKKCW